MFQGMLFIEINLVNLKNKHTLRDEGFYLYSNDEYINI